jgi:hypothetical protein
MKRKTIAWVGSIAWFIAAVKESNPIALFMAIGMAFLAIVVIRRSA